MGQFYLAMVNHPVALGAGLIAGLIAVCLFYGGRYLLRKQIKRVRKAQADQAAADALEFADLEDIPFERPTIVFCGDRCLWSDSPRRDGEEARFKGQD